jgi:hypothetical protein
MLQHQIDWHPSPRPLGQFPEESQVRLRQLDFNRTITVYVADQSLYVRRIGLNKFLWCEVKYATTTAACIHCCPELQRMEVVL